MTQADFLPTIPTLSVTAIIDIVAVAVVIYQLLLIIRGTRAAHILAGIAAVVIAYEVAVRMGLETLRSLLASLVPYTAITIISPARLFSDSAVTDWTVTKSWFTSFARWRSPRMAA